MINKVKLQTYYELAFKLLVQYLQIDTSHTSGIDIAINFWENIYKKYHIRYEIYTHESGKKSICGFVIEKKSEKSILLLNHMDVVPADANNWECDPFSGLIKDGYIYGRGAIDMKGLAIMQLASVLFIRDTQDCINRNIYILSVPDEEIGGFFGAKFVTNNYMRNIEPELVLDEGAFGIKEGNKNTYYVSYSQKKSLWLKLYVDGIQGHAAFPSNDNVNNILISVLNKISKAFIQKHNETRHSLLGKNLENTISITCLSSGSSPNVKPEHAEAILDCRLIPEFEVKKFIDQLQKKISDNRVKIQIIKRTDYVVKSNPKHLFMKSIETSLKDLNYQGSVVPIVSPVGTDAKYFREKGIQGFGFFPIILDNKDIKMMHGINERISIKNFENGINIYTYSLMNYNKEIM